MSDNEDLLGDDLGDQSLADYNLGNEEEEQLLADDYDNGGPQNVPTSIGMTYREPMDMVTPDYPGHVIEYNNQSMPYQAMVETECVVPNVTVEVANAPLVERPTYAPYEPRYEPEHAVPPAIPQSPIESPQIVPSDINAPVSNGDMGGPRERFVSERPVGTQRMPQVRDIPDSLDKVVIPRGGFPPRGRTSWRNPQFAARYSHPYRRNNVHRGNFQRASFPPPQIRPTQLHIRPEIRHDVRPEIRPQLPDIRPEIRPDIHSEIRPDLHPEIRPDMRPEIRPDIRQDMRPEIRPDIRLDMRPEIRLDIRQDMRSEIRPDIRQDMRPDIRPDIRPDLRPEVHPDMRPDIRLEPPQMGPEISPERPILPQEMPLFLPPTERPPFPYRFQFRPEERQFRPNFDPRPVFFRPNFPRPFAPMREIAPNTSHLPQVTIRQAMPMQLDKGPKAVGPREPEVRMLPVSLPPSLPAAGLAGKKVLINPHFKGNFQPPVEGLPTYIPTRIRKTPPLSPTLESKFGPVKDIDDAAERFIAEQRNALARAASRKYARRSPQRYIENTTIEIENDLAQPPARRRSDDDLSRRQEEFINANRAGLRRRMRSPSPSRRSPSPRRSPERRPRNEPARHNDEDTEYKRRLREQESLRERVLRAKEVRRRKNAVALHKQLMDKDRENQEKEAQPKPEEPKPEQTIDKPSSTVPTSTVPENKPDTTRTSPDTPTQERVVEKREKLRERSPLKKEESVEVNSTCETLTPPRVTAQTAQAAHAAQTALTPPLPRADSDDDLDLILGDIDGILSDDDDEGKLNDKTRSEGPKSKPQVDLRSKLPPKPSSAESKKAQRQKIVFNEEKRKKDKTPPRRPVVTSSTKTDDADIIEKKNAKIKQKAEAAAARSRQRITFTHKEAAKDETKSTAFSNRRVILQRKTNQPKDKSVFSRIEAKSDPTKPNPGIFSRAVRTAIGSENTRIVVKKEPEIEFESDSELDEDELLEDVGNIATVVNLPHGMTDTRLKTLAGSDVQNLTLDKEERTARITFKTTAAADTFKKKFNNKMVAASRLTVTLR